MHAQARAWIERTVAAWALDSRGVRVLDAGGRDVNGTPRDLFPGAQYMTTDIVLEPGVDLLWDLTSGPSPFVRPFRIVLCTETLEHVSDWRIAVANLATAVAPDGGRLLITAACDPRAPHSGIDGWDLRDGEHYANVDPAELADVLSDLLDDVRVEADRVHGDVYAEGRKA